MGSRHSHENACTHKHKFFLGLGASVFRKPLTRDNWRQVTGTAHFLFYTFLYNPNNSSIEIKSQIAQADGEFLILLPPPRQHWNYRRAAVVLLCVLSYVGQILDIRVSALSTSELYPLPISFSTHNWVVFYCAQTRSLLLTKKNGLLRVWRSCLLPWLSEAPAIS